MEALKRCTLGAVRYARTAQVLNSSLTKNSAAATYLINNNNRKKSLNKMQNKMPTAY